MSFTRLFSLSIALGFPAILFAAEQPAPVYSPLAPGVEYAHIVQPEIPWSIHVVKYDLHRSDLKLISTLGRPTVFGLVNLTNQVGSVPTSTGHPLVAINGDFFLIKKDPYQGDPEGLQIMDGELVSSPGRKAGRKEAFWIDQHGLPQIGDAQSKLRVTWPNKFSISFGLNEQRAADQASLLTPRLGSSTRTTNGVEFILERNGSSPWLPIRAGQTYYARVGQVETVDSPITPNAMVLSVGPELAKKIPATKAGTTLKISTELSPNLKGDQTALGGGPLLVKKGKAKNSPDKIRAPRTAIGWNDKSFYMVVVDGRQKKLSDGMTFGELAVEMAELGCTEALNLDGGGSTTMWIEGKVVNSPSDGHLRSLGNALVLVGK